MSKKKGFSLVLQSHQNFIKTLLMQTPFNKSWLNFFGKKKVMFLCASFDLVYPNCDDNDFIS